MKSLPSAIRVLLSALVLWSAMVQALPAEQQPVRRLALPDDTAEARVIVQFKAGADTLRRHALSSSARENAGATADVMTQRAAALGARRGIALGAGRAISDRMQVVTATGIDSATLAQALAADSEVEHAEVDHRRRALAVPSDPLYAPTSGTSPASGQWYLKAPTANAAVLAADVVSSINAPGAWDITTGSASIVVAVVDTGVRFDHPDLANQLLAGYDMVSNTTISNDGSARDADASDPGDYVTSAEAATSTFSNCDVADSSWHGTMVSGLVGASGNNGIGMAGVGWNLKILPVRVLGKCFGYDSDIIAGMRWAAGLSVAGVPANTTPARVINLSLGGDGSCSSSYASAVSEITAAGAVIVAAAGNTSGHAVGVPANCSGVVGVAGLRHIGTKVGYSDVGSALAIAAPGGNCVNSTGSCLYPILSTTNTGNTTPVAGSAGASYTDGNNYAVGTSFSAPLVSGTAALMLSANPSLTPAQVTSLLKSTARAFPTSGADSGVATCHAPDGTDQLECYCTTSTCGAGMLDAAAAVSAASEAVQPTDASLQANISVTPSSPTAGTAVVLDGTGSLHDNGRSIASHAWSIVSGGGIISGFSGSSSGSSATVVPSGAGQFTVRLTITDDIGLQSTVDSTVTVSAAATPSGGTGSSGSSSGGGAFSWAWLVALALAAALLRPGRPGATR
jgi:serine protease